ncbi:MAG: DUF2259 domain-containing protein [Spirochaetota bacterium]
MKHRHALAVLTALLTLAPLAAGDLAAFVDLGFSADSSCFMYGQYGIDASTSGPWAELGIVDTRKNQFLPKGHLEKAWPRPIEAGISPIGALFSLYAEAAPLAASKRLDPLESGRLIYALVDGVESPARLEFQDFGTDDVWTITMNKSVAEPKEGSPRSSFGLQLERTQKDGSVQRVSAGNLSIVREGVRDYVIRSVILAPDGRTVVIVVEKAMVKGTQRSVRSMVETCRMP